MKQQSRSGKAAGFDLVTAFLGMLTHALSRQRGAIKAEQASPVWWEQEKGW